MRGFLTYWYTESAARFYWSWVTTVNSLEAQFAVQETLHNLSKPLFQDYSFEGRVIALPLRLLRILGGGFVYLLCALAYAGLYAFWLIFPAFCLLSLISPFIFLISNPS